MNIYFQNASHEDAFDIATLHNQSVRVDYDGQIPDEYIKIEVNDRRVKAWEGWINRSQVSTIVARMNAELVGFSTLQPNNESSDIKASGELIGIYVLRPYWNQGIGWELFNRVLQEAKNRKFSEIVVWDLESNVAGRDFYESLGFCKLENKRIFLERADGPIEEVKYHRNTL